MKPLVVLYHGNCPDGFSSAWAAWKKFKNKASYLPVQHQAPPPSGLTDKEIYLLDFCYNPPFIKKLLKENKHVILIDHHVSAKPSARLIKEKVFDMKHAASVLVWRYFHPHASLPRLLEYVEDYDMWKFRRSHTKEINAALELQNYTFKNWDRCARLVKNTHTRKKLIAQGKLILQLKEKTVKKLADKAELVKWHGHRVLAVNSPVLASELGHELVKRKPPCGVIWYEEKGKIKVSLRSNGKLNVAKIAEKYGGGGHRTAASFKLERGKKCPWKICDIV